MSNVSTPAAGRNFGIEDEAETLGNVVGGQAEFAKSLFTAIAELSTNPKMTQTVIGLAKCGQWVSENMDADVDYMVDNILSRCRRGLQ